MAKLIIAHCFVLLLVFNFNKAEQDTKIVSARIESCPGCSLKRLTQVRAFLYEDVPKYENVEWKKIQGAPPELLFLNEADEEVERIKLEKYNREECNDLLKSKGFRLKDSTKQKEL
ncbi:unnamed protein product [Ceutorhynchus assimilis]|uniref:Selenoprotein M n=1 Tax=Ceutorhynchus assimilis TaxID=467358 RepID=A0A9N9MWF8_9CUCU|nr:unnamed protein product [Ceutorhynchus assimilis]